MCVFGCGCECLICSFGVWRVTYIHEQKRIRLESMVETLRRNQHHHISSSSSLGSDHRYPNRITNRFCHRMLHNLYGVARFVVHRSTFVAYRRHTNTHIRARDLPPIRSIHVVVHFVWILHSLAFTALIGIIQINILFLSLHKFLLFFSSLWLDRRARATPSAPPLPHTIYWSQSEMKIVSLSVFFSCGIFAASLHLLSHSHHMRLL